MNELTHVSLFSGIGNIDLAAEAAGFRTTLQVEIEEFQRTLLWKHWPDTPKIGDIRDVTEEKIKEIGIGEPTILSGGFPCQPFSTAGKRKGKNDDRYLWPEIIRVARLLKPSWIVGENVVGITSMEQPEPVLTVEKKGKSKSCYERTVAEIIRDLEKEGFLLPRNSDGTPIVLIIPASAVGACHRRYRVFFVAYNQDNGRNRRAATERWEITDRAGREEVWDKPGRQNTNASNPYEGGCCSRSPEGVRVYRGEQACNEAGTGNQCVVHSDSAIQRGRELLLCEGKPGQPLADPVGSDNFSAYLDGGRESQQFYTARARWVRKQAEEGWKVPWPEAATRFCGVVDGDTIELDGSGGFPDPLISRAERKKRIMCLGNAVVPSQIYPIFEAIAKIEMSIGKVY